MATSSDDNDEIMKKSLEKICKCNQMANTCSTPFYQTKYASNSINDEYGNIKPVTYSAMRQNYRERIEHIMNDVSNEVGLSAGGGEYIVPNYKSHFQQFYRPNCDMQGRQKFKNAYGRGNEGQCKIHYEEY